MSDPRTPSDDGLDLHADDVSRVYRGAAREEPSSALDEAICAASRRGAGARPRAIVRSFAQRWKVSLAIAATLVIGVSVAFLAVDRPDSPTSLSANAPVGGAGDTARSKLAPTGSREQKEAPPYSEVRADAGEPAAESQVQPPIAAGRETRPSRDRTSRDEMIAKREAPPALAPAQPPTPSSSTKLSQVPAVAPRDAAHADAVQAAPSVASPLPSAETQLLRRTAPRAEIQADHEAELLSPEVWLQRIRDLRARGDLAEAEASLRSFRHRYPDYPLPADISSPTDAGR